MEEPENNFNRFFRPSTHGFSELSSLTCPSDSSIVFGVGDAPPVFQNIFEILFGFGEVHSLDGFGSLIGIFIMGTDVLSRGFGNLIRIRISGVSCLSHNQSIIDNKLKY